MIDNINLSQDERRAKQDKDSTEEMKRLVEFIEPYVKLLIKTMEKKYRVTVLLHKENPFPNDTHHGCIIMSNDHLTRLHAVLGKMISDHAGEIKHVF
jgi:hypothetical protein